MSEPTRPISPTPQPNRTPGSNARGCLAVLGVAGAVLVGALVLNQGDDDNTASSTPSSTTSYAASPSSQTTYEPPTPAPSNSAAAPAPAPTSAAPSPYESGTCLNGTLPNSETAQEVSGVEEVPCSASDAHYRVIQTIPLTSDLSRCKSNPRTQYAFSYRYTLNGTAINEYVYCLVGLGSYAR
ncbi:LppU/SCO3897 family protein [Streptomyces sp. NRRL S-920]|uniref:LppU/SCO3897 family protein n=1 Tax=Streptomyces sp. NRRL S-920 TaxID=1463921 RepID=UPI000689971C|nr:hypothetical protein [Streptomyces sp. NRRL S-920]